MADNVFALLAQQEMDRPQRELQQMQVLQQKMALKKLMDEQQYNDSMKSYLAAQPQTRDITSLSSIPTPIARDANAPAFDTGEGGLLASMDPVSEQTVKDSQPISLNDRFRQQYDYHMANGRTDKAQEVLDHQVELAGKAAKVVDQMFKAGGQPAVASFLQSNPQYADLVGSYKDLKFSQEGVLHPHTDEQGNVITGMYWNIGKDGVPVTHKVEATTNKVNSGFQDAIAGLTGMSEQRNDINPQDSPYAHYRVGNTPITSRYAPFSEVEKDIRSAGATYGATAEDINKAVDDARTMYKETYVQGAPVHPKGGKSSYTPQYNLMGDQKDVGKVQDINISNSMPKPGRLVQAFDKETRNLVYVGADDIRENPSRYAPAGAQMKANQQQTLIEDIRGTINNTMNSLDKMPPFTSTQQAQIALALKERDPRSAISQFMGSKVGQTLSPQQVDYITDLAVLKENILAMRSLLGGGQSSQDQRAAIEATIPGSIQPNKEFAKVQLQKALRTLDRLERGTANGSLRPEKGATGGNASGTPPRTWAEFKKAKGQ